MKPNNVTLLLAKCKLLTTNNAIIPRKIWGEKTKNTFKCSYILFAANVYIPSAFTVLSKSNYNNLNLINI